MLVLHALWNPREEGEGELLLWGEDSDRPYRPIRRNSAREEKLHPLMCSPARLKEMIGRWRRASSPESAEFQARPVGFTLLLPTEAGFPIPSPELPSERPVRDGGDASTLELLPWHVKGLRLPVPEAAEFLALLPAGLTDEPVSLPLASDARFWSAAAKFALDLLLRGSFYATVRRMEGAEIRAVWEPLVRDTADRQRLELLSKAMPPACRALQSEDGDGDQPPSSRQLLTDFLRSAVDGLARGWLAATPPRSGHSYSWYQPSTAVGRWVKALWSPSGKVVGTAFELRSLQHGLEAWTEPLRASLEKNPFRTCFRLEPPVAEALDGDAPVYAPDPSASDWTLRFLLQATDDPSLLVEADRVWRESGATLRYLNRRFERPQERLLADLGRAARLFPKIEESLRSTRPSACPLTTEEAYRFLVEAAPLLEESGYGVLVPNWWEKRTARRQLGLKLQMTGGPGEGLMGMDAIVQYDWQLALGDQTITKEEFQRLAALKTPLVHVRGQWVELNPDQVRQAMKFWESGGRRGEMSLGEALRTALAPESGDGLEITGVETAGWLAELLKKLSTGERIGRLSQPRGFSGKLRPYQVRGFSWLSFLRRWGLGACLADDMGLGKTIQLIALLLHDRERGAGRRPTLLICPTSVIGNWEREVSRFGPSLKVLVHHGASRHGEVPFGEAVRGYDLVVSSYGLAHRDEEHFASVDWEGVVLDEAQNIKNPSTKQAQSIRKLRAGYRVALTGTPVENRLSELWSIMEFLNPGYLGSLEGFRKQFAIPIERWQDKERAQRLRSLVRPFILRRLKTDPKVIKDLPEKIEMKVFCPLTAEQATLYEAVVQEMLRQIEESEGIQRKGLVLSTLLRLKQVCNHPAQYLGDNSPLPKRSGKLARLEEMLEEALSEGDRALVFTQFAEFGSRLRAHLQETLGREVLFLHGAVPQQARDRMVARFQEDPSGPPIFILSLKAGGTGLNLTRANHVFHYDRWWNPAVEDQATDRAFRIGQKRNVQVHKFLCSGTLEERIDDLIESKKGLAEAAVGTGEGWLTELSTDQLRDLFALRRERVMSDE